MRLPWVDADLGLSGGDLHAAEWTVQLLHQVTGFTGRAEALGLVLPQTFSPEHPVRMQALVRGTWRRSWPEAARKPWVLAALRTDGGCC